MLLVVKSQDHDCFDSLVVVHEAFLEGDDIDSARCCWLAQGDCAVFGGCDRESRGDGEFDWFAWRRELPVLEDFVFKLDCEVRCGVVFWVYQLGGRCPGGDVVLASGWVEVDVGTECASNALDFDGENWKWGVEIVEIGIAREGDV